MTIILGAGTGLRIWGTEFRLTEPLWLDEAMLSVGLGTHSVFHLFRSLSFDQMAPALYLLLVKGSIGIYDDGEWRRQARNELERRYDLVKEWPFGAVFRVAR